MDLARLTIDLGALRANYRALAEVAPGVGAVVKADAYGLGARQVAETLCLEGCAHFFVATLAEGLQLAGHLGQARIYVFAGPMDADEAAAMAAHDLTPVLNDAGQVARWRRHGELPVAVHVDTAMHRLGFDADGLDPALFDGLDVTLLMSHLANADDPDDPTTDAQVARFARLSTLFSGAATSLGNSAGLLSGVSSDVLRPGIALFGGNPFARTPNPMQPVATLEARVVALRTVPAGRPVGYGGTFTTRGETRIAVLGVGYADGVPRALSNRTEVAYEGSRLPVVGRVSMDLMQVDATSVQDRIAVGDWVEVFGRIVGVDEIAAAADTIGYEILTRIGPRVARRYIDD